MGVVFGLLTALSIGASDLFGRRILHREGPLTATVPMQFFGVMTSLVSVLFIPSEFLAGDLALGALSGVGFAVGLGCYYGGLRRASSAVIAPTVAMISAVIPLGYSILRGSAPTLAVSVGAVIALVGIVVITVDGGGAVDWTGARWGAVSGLGYAFGLSVLIDASDAGGMWPAVSQRASALVALALVARRSGAPLVPLPTNRSWAVLAGVAVGFSSIFYLLGVGVDPTPTVITTSVFPAVAVVVGLAVYNDPVRRAQWIGIAIVIVGIVAISL